MPNRPNKQHGKRRAKGPTHNEDVYKRQTYGRRTRAVIITDSDHVVLSAFEPEEVLGRFEKEQDKPTV